MSYNLVDPTTGDLTQVAGRGRAEYGASTVRQGAITIPGQSPQTYQTVAVTFDTPMPDVDYHVVFKNRYGSGDVINIEWQTKNGFTFTVFNVGGASGTHLADYFAFKLYSDIDYSRMVNSFPADASASNKLTTQADLNVIGQSYQSSPQTVTEGSWATKNFVFSDLPKGTYIIGARVLASASWIGYANISELGMQLHLSTGFGSTACWQSPWVITQETTGSKTLSYSCCNDGNSVSLEYKLILTRLA